MAGARSSSSPAGFTLPALNEMNFIGHAMDFGAGLSNNPKMDQGYPFPQIQGPMIDWKSQQSSSTHRPTSSIYSDDMSIMTYLIHKLSEDTRTQEYETADAFLRENRALEEEIALHRKAWNGTIAVANEIIQAITTIRKSLITVETKVARAEKDWLAFWGIYEESLGEHRPWI